MNMGTQICNCKYTQAGIKTITKEISASSLSMKTRLPQTLSRMALLLDFRCLSAREVASVVANNLGKCTLFLALELTSSSGDLVRDFCSAALSEYAKSSLRDQIYKFSRRLCSSLLSLEVSRYPLITDLLMTILYSTANACKVDGGNSDMEFVELVSYCANKCRTSRTIICSHIAKYLIELADDFAEEAEAKATASDERERSMNERLSQTLSRINVFEAQISRLRAEHTQLSKSLEKERQRAAENRQEYFAAKEKADTKEGRANQL